MRAFRLNVDLSEAPALACVIAISAIVFLSGAFQAGFLSDDFDLLARAGTVSVWAPLERHHFSPLLTALFKLGAAGCLPAWKWRVIAWLAHAVNTLLVHRLARVGLRQSAPVALCLALLFALNPAGYEALAWSSAIGYTLVSVPILVALNIALSGASGPRAAWRLAGLQFAAFLIWDWGILLAPLAGVSAFMRRQSEGKPAKAPVFRLMLPAGVVWVLGLAAKLLMLPGMGYPGQAVGSMLALQSLAASPLLALAPNMTIQAYQSSGGILAAAFLLAALCWAVFRMPEARLPAALFALCQVPHFLFGAPQSRYFYMPCAFIYCIVLIALFRLPRLRGAALLAALLAAVSLWWAMERSLLWRSAWRQARIVREQILALPDEGNGLVIVNLPDSYGPEGLIWRPYVWRNGMPGIGRSFERVNTPGCPFIWEKGPVPVLPRASILAQYRAAAIYEVVGLRQGSLIAFSLKRIDGARGPGPGDVITAD